MKSSRTAAHVLKILRDREVICPICGAGWRIIKATNMTLLAEAVEHHVAQHRRISVVRTYDVPSKDERAEI
jgi:hypothetical protein